MKATKLKKHIPTHIVLSLSAVIMMYPLAFAVLGALISMDDFYHTTFIPWPKEDGFSFVNFSYVFAAGWFFKPLLITLLRFAWSTLFLFITSMLGGYVFSIIRFKGQAAAFAIIMSSMMLPGVALMMPQYIMMAKFPLVGGNNILGQGGSGFIDNPAIFFVTGLFSSYNIFLVRQAFLSIGAEYKEAAEIDGANFFQTVFFIYAPMVKPILAVIILNQFIGMWNDYLFPLMFMGGNSEWQPIGLSIVNLINAYLKPNGVMGRSDYPAVFGISLTMMTPPILVFVLCQKYFISGLTMGGVKG